MGECNGDFCEIDVEFEAALGNKLYPSEPMDYDAPGSTVREQGV